jgi:hypothetical protein
LRRVGHVVDRVLRDGLAVADALVLSDGCGLPGQVVVQDGPQAELRKR